MGFSKTDTFAISYSNSLNFLAYLPVFFVLSAYYYGRKLGREGVRQKTCALLYNRQKLRRDKKNMLMLNKYGLQKVIVSRN